MPLCHLARVEYRSHSICKKKALSYLDFTGYTFRWLSRKIDSNPCTRNMFGVLVLVIGAPFMQQAWQTVGKRSVYLAVENRCGMRKAAWFRGAIIIREPALIAPPYSCDHRLTDQLAGVKSSKGIYFVYHKNAAHDFLFTCRFDVLLRVTISYNRENKVAVIYGLWSGTVWIQIGELASQRCI